MAITYNNLYMDIRQELHRAGIQLRGRLVQSDFLSMGFQKCFAVISLREPQRKDPHKIQKRFLYFS